MLRETAKRGLIYVDDGASPRSVAGQLAGSHNLPFAKSRHRARRGADAGRDRPRAGAAGNGGARSRQRRRLATALPATVERIAEWAKTVEGRGIVLVPITMVAVKAKSS